MHKLSYLLVAAAIGGFAISAGPGSANPLISKMTGPNASVPEVSDGLVQKVHGWHCGRKWSKRLGRHRHRRACYDNDYSYGHPGYGYGYGYGYPAHDLGFAPYFSFGSGFYDDDYRFRRHYRHHRWGDHRRSNRHKRRHHLDW
jgi:hypothetical protein